MNSLAVENCGPSGVACLPQSGRLKENCGPVCCSLLAVCDAEIEELTDQHNC